MRFGGTRSERVDVWINPAQHQDAHALADALGREFHLIVVPKTGSRKAEVAVLCDPVPQEVSRLRHILSGVPLVATTTSAPSVALQRELRRSHGTVLVRPSGTELVAAVRRASRGSTGGVAVIS